MQGDNLLIRAFNFCWTILNHEFHYYNFHFTLWNVCEVTLILCLTGHVIGKIIFLRSND